MFHDAAELVATNAVGDATVLTDAGYTLVWQNRAEGFHRAWVERDGHGVKIEWVYDSAFRFFPVVPDPLLGYRLHDADLAVNKVLAGTCTSAHWRGRPLEKIPVCRRCSSSTS